MSDYVCIGVGGGNYVCIGLTGKSAVERAAIIAAAKDLATSLGTTSSVCDKPCC